MNRIKNIILTLVILAGFTSCELFLEMPEVTGSVYKEDVFSNRKDAEGMLWRAYHRALRDGLPEGWQINHGTLASFSGEISRGLHKSIVFLIWQKTVLSCSAQRAGKLLQSYWRYFER